jgi:copper chaperone
MEQTTLDVKGMTCGHCVASVSGTLKGIGASEVNVDLKTGKVEVSYDKDKITVEQMKEAIEDQGYDVI